MNKLHKIYLVLISVLGLPITLLGLLLSVPAALDKSPAVIILLLPALFIVWAIILLVKQNRIIKLKKNLLIYYSVVGAISAYSTTWTFYRDGHTGYIFDPFYMIPVILFFSLPIYELTTNRST